MLKMFKFIAFAVLWVYVDAQCNPTITKAKGWHAPSQICAGQLIFEDNFDWFDFTKWQHEINTDGGGNNEFQAYVDSRTSSFVKDGNLHIVPHLPLDVNQPQQTSIPHPVHSARLRSRDGFSFKYGRVEINARLPLGDWLWPALWLLPEDWVFGGWPMSGEIDLMESRGNRDLAVDGNQIGVESVGSTLHFGPRWDHSAWPTAHKLQNYAPGYHQAFHRYGMVWTPEKFDFFIDGELYHTIEVGTGFWDRGNFESTGLDNPWIGHEVNAPFDQEFHILINLAVGGTFFPDTAVNGNGPKPWTGSSPDWKLAFWNGRSQWLSSWNRETEDSHFRVDYVRVWAL